MLDDVVAGDFRAVARLITLVENEAPEAVPYLRALYPHTGRCLSIGVTGSPGAGKSTLVDRLAGHFRNEGKKVGIIAIDPSSPFTGGAILGDRIRMQSRSIDPGTFIRSMATRGNLGGVARATADVLLVMDAAGFEIVMIETVGVGQDEVEVARMAEVTLVLLVPGMGDDIQTMKAGIMEIGDVFVINKADHAGVERIEAELSAVLSITGRHDGWKPAVVKTVASEGKGIEELARAVTSWRERQRASGSGQQKAVRMQRDRLLEVARSEVMRALLRRPGAAERLDDLARKLANREIDPYTAAEQFLSSR